MKNTNQQIWLQTRIQHKPGYAVTENSLKLEISDFKKEEELYYRCSQSKGAIVSAQLVCTCVLPKIRFSLDASEMISTS